MVRSGYQRLLTVVPGHLEISYINNDEYCILIRQSQMGTTVLIGYVDELRDDGEITPAGVLSPNESNAA